MRRLASCVGVLLLMAAVRLLAAVPGLVTGQHGAADNVTSSITLSPTGVTNGNSIIVGISQAGADVDQTVAVSDTINGSYDLAVGPIRSTGGNGNRTCYIYYKSAVSTTAGALTITGLLANGNQLTRGQWLEVSGPITLNQFSSVPDTGDTASHTAASPAMTTAADVFVYMIAAQNATATFTTTASPMFTTLTGDFASTTSVSEYYSNATGLSSSTISWTGGTARTAASCSSAFIETAAPGTGIPNALSLLGAGR